MIFPQFNCLVNPKDEAVYYFKDNQTVKLKFNDVVAGLRTNSERVIMWHIPKDHTVIKISNKVPLLQMLIDNNAKVLAYESKLEGCYYVVCKASIRTKVIKTVVGLQVAYMNTTVILPFKLKSATSKFLESLVIVYDKSIEDIPDVLYPSEGKYSWVSPIKGNPVDVLTLILRNLPRWTKEKKKGILTTINKYFCEEPRTEQELAEILEKACETAIEDFFSGNDFRHDALGEYLIKTLHIKKDYTTGDLYYYDSSKQIYDNNQEYLYGYITKNYSILKEYQRKEVIQFITHYLYEDCSTMNTNPYSIVFNNGILDIRDMTLKEMCPDYLESIKIEYDYTKYAYSETIDKFFKDLSCNDKEVELLFYEAIGYALLKTSELQVSFTLLGSEGRNGKSTYLDLLKTIVGKKHYTSIAYKDLANNFRASDLVGKLISACGDISAQPINDTDLYKSIVAGEDIMVERKYKDAKAINLFSTMFYSCNKLARTPDTSGGFYRRQTIIPCEANLSDISKIEGMQFKLKLLEKESIEYCIYKAVQAIHDVFKRGDFTKSTRVEAVKQSYIEENSSVLSWIKDMYGSTDGVRRLTFKNAWRNYKIWVEDVGRKQLNQTNFKSELRAHGIVLEE